MSELKKVLSVAKTVEGNENAAQAVDREDKARVICQINLTHVRCGSCNALLAKATTGSVLGIVCHRCKSYNFIEVAK